MALARSKADTWTYILKSDRDRPEEEQTLWTLRRLPNRVRIALENLNRVDPINRTLIAMNGDAKLVALHAGIANVERFAFDDGEVAKITHKKGRHLVKGIEIDDPVDEAFLDLLELDDAEELAQAIVNGNTATTDDVKN